MKKLFGFLCAVGITASIFSFNNNNVTDFESNTDSNISKSYITWVGSKLDKSSGTEKAHHGIVEVKDAKIKMVNEKLPEAVSVTVDLGKITNADLTDELKGKLITHLQSADFFNISVFPDAKFTSTKITKLENDKLDFKMDGNITIKGITKPISVKAHIVKMKNEYLLESENFLLDGKEFKFIKDDSYNDVSLRVQVFFK